MGVAVYNISATTARVSWPRAPGCLDTFYSVMYDPNWNSLLMGYKRKSFMHEERVPVSQTATRLAHLLPHTAYFLCVTCQAANPERDQCQVFSTLSQSGEGPSKTGWELAMGVWLTCCVLLLVIAGVLLWGCVHTLCTLPGQTAAEHSGSSIQSACPPRGREDGGRPAGQQTSGHVAEQDHELRSVSRLSDTEPV